MTESEFEAAANDKPSALSRIWSGWQWLLGGVLALLALLFAIVNGNLSAPGAPVVGYWISVVAFALVAVLLCPPAFFRLPKVGKILAYIAILPALIFVSLMLGQVQEAHKRTPEGAKEAAERTEKDQIEKREAAAKAVADKDKAENADLLARVEADGEKLKEIIEQQDDCLSWGGELKDLNRMVQDSLHNPDSFEHVSTEFIVPTEDRHNVLLTFRAENGFGATRAARVTASMVPESCEILEVGEPQPL